MDFLNFDLSNEKKDNKVVIKNIIEGMWPFESSSEKVDTKTMIKNTMWSRNISKLHKSRHSI